MSCNDPRKVFYVGVNPETGKKKIFYTNRYVDYIWRRSPADKWHTVRIPESQNGTHGMRNESLYKDQLNSVPSLNATVIKESDLVPCGQCLGCRMDYAKRWAARIMMECKNYENKKCWFVTFTYNEDHLPPLNDVTDPTTGEIKKAPFHSLSKREHQLLMKRIRKHYGDGIRFFMSGEYGSKSFRPHYHYILFGLDKPDDLKPYKVNFQGDMLYTSKSFKENVWSEIDLVTNKPKVDPITGEIVTKGYVIFGEVTNESAAYVARYTIKKRKNMPKEDYELLGIEPEFCLMSRRPGIGSDYINDNYLSIYETDSITVPTKNGAMSIQPPPYYDSILERLDPVLYEQIKSNRKKNAELYNDITAANNPDLDLDVLYETRERVSENKIIVKKGGDL